MGRERQKKKARSSLPKTRQKPKSKKMPIKGNALVAAQWNKHETLTQNYRRLGLTARLNGPTGGVERRARDVVVGGGGRTTAAGELDPLAIKSKTPTSIVPGEARVERDEKGAIVRIVRHAESSALSPGAASPWKPLGDPLNELSSSEGEDNSEGGVGRGRGEISSRTVPAAGGLIAELEEQARRVAPKIPRKQSTAEREWIERLVAKYGEEDYRGMFWDRKLNPMQQSEGDIRRRVEKWKKERRKLGMESVDAVS